MSVNDYFTYADESQNESQILFSSKADEDALLIDLVKDYPHLYNKESRDFKDILKKNNSWEEIAKILDAKGIKHFSLYQYYVIL